ncbi:uncharacterized protein B0J16DRAFT_416585 [Fusarium flagelliforme]|uniref:uncharacterized protein n=1 Tax=Fusarium flagelliforme TaxID=2675880 RepID=UPI001E8DAA08|nr:uncharacterized protein B0J16DRAFT_416585 [Fusarium flagelliforme]KAH7183536.1 hypothetical protein B0J16DRAFT_416585 [Fusarium flagelliforme]
MVDCDNTDDAEFDADIAGLGVLIAFLATSLVAISTLVVAFMSFSVPSRLLNTGDTVMACGFRRFRRRLHLDDSKLKQVNTRNERIDAYKAFLHSTSDQILVSQVAILVAATKIQAEITIYSANIVIALGCLASTVHLGCFPFYVDRLRDHDIAKHLRFITMIGGSGILVFWLIVQLSYTWDMESHVYFTCVLKDYRLDGGDLFDNILAIPVPFAVLFGTYDIWQILYRQEPRDNEAVGGETQGLRRLSRAAESPDGPQQGNDQDIEMQTLQTALPQRLYEHCSGSSTITLSRLEQEVLAIGQALEVGGNESNSSENGYGQFLSRLFQRTSERRTIRAIRDQTLEDKRPTLLNRWLQLKALKILTRKPKSRRSLKTHIYRIAERWAYHQCRGSFVWRIFWLWSGNVYGIIEVFASRCATTELEGDPDHWGFGQVVPLALLALPIFTAMEGYADYKRQVRAKTQDYQESARETSSRVTTPTDNPIVTAQPTQTAMSRDEDKTVQFVKELLRDRARNLGYPCLYDWVRGVALEEQPILQVAAGLQAVFMLLVTSFLGSFMASGFSIGNSVLLGILAAMIVRRVVDLVFISDAVTGLPLILDKLGCDGTNESVQVRDHARHMMAAQAAGEMEQDAEDDE